jgi:hypothetical protein
VTSVLPMPDVVCGGQSKHSTAPLTSLYVPLTQAVHSWPSDPVYPLAHLQSFTDVLLTAEMVAFGQDEHDTFPTMDLYVSAAHTEHSLALTDLPHPTLHRHELIASLARSIVSLPVGQDWHADDPGVVLYDPSEQATHKYEVVSSSNPASQTHVSLTLTVLFEHTDTLPS